MITTTAAGRTWHFDRSLGRPTNEHNGTVGGFRYPTDLAVAAGEVLFVLNKGYQITEQMDHRDNGRIGKTTFEEHHLGDFARQDFTWPGGIALDSQGWVYATDEHDNVVHKYDPDGVVPYPGVDSCDEAVTTWGETGSDPGQLDGPNGIQFDDDDNLYVVESRNNRVQKFSKDGQFISGFGSHGTDEGEFDRPWGITIDKEGDVYVVDWGNSRVQQFSADGEYIMTFGTSFGGELNHPANVAVDSEGDIYVTDWGNNRVQIYDEKGGVSTSLYGDATQFSQWAQQVVDSNPDVVKAYRRVKDLRPLGRFARPLGIAVDEEDRIIVTYMTRGRLQVYAKEKDYMDSQFNL